MAPQPSMSDYDAAIALFELKMAETKATRKLEESIEERIALWINTLKADYSFHDEDEDTSGCAYCKAIFTFQRFTDSVIAGLQSRNKEAVELVTSGFLFKVYCRAKITLFHDVREAHEWVKNALTVHPHRRKPNMQLFLLIAKVQSYENANLIAKRRWVENKLNAWAAEVVLPENIEEDPDELWLFRVGSGLEPVGDSDDARAGLADECPVCFERYDQPGCSSNAEHIPMRTLCNHAMCRKCCEDWVESSEGSYTCPLCRACLVCRRSDCPYHTIDLDPAPPVPLKEVIAALPGKDQTIGAAHYVLLREATRKQRSYIAYYDAMLLQQDDVDQHDSVYQKWEEERDQIWNEIAITVEAFRQEYAEAQRQTRG